MFFEILDKQTKSLNLFFKILLIDK